MKRRIVFLAAMLLIVFAAAFQLGFVSPKANAGDPSCNGKCNRAYNACVATARTVSAEAQCNKAYQGCISSCH